MGQSLAHKIIAANRVEGELVPGKDIALKVDQCLIQDATGTMVWLQFDQLGLPRVKPRVVVQYVDHNMIQDGFENADDHLFLQSLCAKYGAIFSRAGNGISHFAHLERFDVPGEVLIGSDSHTCAAGRWRCWRSAPAGSKWPPPSPASLCGSRCQKCGG